LAVFQIIAILKAMEVQVLSERTRDGLKAARARGKKMEGDLKDLIIRAKPLLQLLYIIKSFQ